MPTPLLQSQRLLHALQTTARIGVWRLELPTMRLEWSEEVYRIHELPLSFALNHERAVEFFTPDSRPLITQALQQCIDHGTPWDMDLAITTRRGLTISVRTVGQAVRDERGRVRELYGTFQDLTERERALDQMRTFVNQAPVPIAMLDRELRYLSVSDRWLEQLGTPQAPLLGRTLQESHRIFSDEWITQIRQCLSGAIRRDADDPWWDEERSMMRWFRWEAHPWHALSGGIGGVILFVEDTTPFKRALVERQDAANRLSQVVRQSPGVVFELELQGIPVTDQSKISLRFVSEQVQAIVGIPPAALTARPGRVIELLPIHERAALQRALTKSASYGSELVWSGSIGRHWIRLRARPKRSGSNSVVWFGFALDCTREREMELAIEAQQTRDRVQNLQGEHLAALGVMAGGIAHEINNPLTIVLGKAQSLLQRFTAPESTPPTNDEVVQALQRIIAKTERIAAIVRGMRLFARLDQDRALELEPLTPQPLTPLLHDTIAFCEGRIRQLGIEPEIKIAENAVVACRPVQIGQVLLNLINNACDALAEFESTPAMPRRLMFTVERRLQSLEIRVANTGAPISDAIRPRLMEPFFTTKPTGHGSGLGLSICRGIVEAHGGTLRLGERADATEFVVSLPVVDSTGAAARPVGMASAPQPMLPPA